MVHFILEVYSLVGGQLRLGLTLRDALGRTLRLALTLLLMLILVLVLTVAVTLAVMLAVEYGPVGGLFNPTCDVVGDWSVGVLHRHLFMLG